ncbi:hypothetical protein Sjap_005055 [Stephania japonica]|uniref:Uncharacterized protein n=1 Tax=Stephania japonica TaxID=461633 RepID=A0AAP0K3D0_9MAGN
MLDEFGVELEASTESRRVGEDKKPHLGVPCPSAVEGKTPWRLGIKLPEFPPWLASPCV